MRSIAEAPHRDACEQEVAFATGEKTSIVPERIEWPAYKLPAPAIEGMFVWIA
jgi:hypothetical protein